MGGVSLLAIAALCGTSACASLATVKGPSAPLESAGGAACTDRYVAPVLDTVGGLVPATLLGGLLVAQVSDVDGRSNRGPALAGAVVMTGLAALSATYGYWKVGDCRESKRAAVAKVGRTPLEPPLSFPFRSSLGQPARN